MAPPSSAPARKLATAVVGRARLALAIAAIATAGLGAAPPADAPNRELPPAASPELDERARLLLDAIARGQPELAEPMFFPREPFLALKDVDDPARYHAQLLAAFRRDVQTLHGRRRSWDGVTFHSFELGTPPRWVSPGREWNKIGYHRSLRSHLAYEVDGRVRRLEIHTIISWDGRWYVTHLLPFRR